jgi:hypothetical protein
MLLLPLLLFLAPIDTAKADADETSRIVLVVGAEGTAEFGEQFAHWAERWKQAATQGSTPLQILGRDVTQASETKSDTPADKQRLQSLLEAEKKNGERPLWLVFIGHGTFDGRSAKFNLRGPDLSADELAAWLKPFTRPLVIVNCTSSSGPFLSKLTGRGRIVITATRSGNELNYARFGDYFSAAIADPSADLDKDGQTSLLEAYLAASHRVEEFYQQEARLATEHALLDDNGDGLGTPAGWFEGIRATRRAKDGAELDGTRAHQIQLVPSARELAMPAELRKQRDELELAVEALRSKKATMNEEEYYTQLEPVLVQLAQLYQQAETRKESDKGTPPDTTPEKLDRANPAPSDDAKPPDNKAADQTTEPNKAQSAN